MQGMNDAGTMTMAPGVPIDIAKLRDRLQDDTVLLTELAQLFLEDAPKQIEHIRVAILRRDTRGMEMSAHALKGAASVFLATPLADAARLLENKGHHGTLANVREDFEILEEEWARLVPELNQLCLVAQTS